MDFPNADEIRAAITPAGGYTSATLRDWGIPFPPPKGWLRAIRKRDEQFFRRHKINVTRPTPVPMEDDLFTWG